MKRTQTKFLSLLLCLAMLFVNLSHPTTAAKATEITPQTSSVVSVSENTGTSAGTDTETTAETMLPEINSEPADTTEENTESETTTITAWFYDSDGTTLLFSLPMEYSGTAVNLCDVYPNYNLIQISRKGYALDYWYCPETDKKHSAESVYERVNYKKDKIYTAVWETKPYTMDISYSLNGGAFAEGTDIPDDFTVESPDITLPTPQRAGYLFDGWYTDASLTKATNVIPTGTYIDSDENGDIAPYTVYAKWTACTPGIVSTIKATHPSTGKIKISFASVEGAAGYELTYATNKKFSKNKLTKDLGSKTKNTISNLKTGTTLYFKVRAYSIDSTGQKCYGKYSAIASCKAKKGVKEYTAKRNSGKLQNVIVKNGSYLYVQAKVNKRLKSSDAFYYLVKVDPNTGKVLKQIAKTDKSKNVKFTLPLKDEKGNNHIHGKFGVAVKKGKKYMLITSTSFINNPEDAASYTAPFPTPASKKGRQGVYSTSLGDKNYFQNFCLNTILGTKDYHHVAYKYNGKTYYFLYPNFGQVAEVNKDGGTVTMQIMLQYTNESKDLILKSGRSAGANYYAFNTDTKASREKIEAAFNFLAEYASQEDYHIDNWILGNEVNTYANMNAKWYYAGNISRDKFINNYASTFRMLYYAVKSNNKNGRVYICCDHTWINRENDWGTKYFTKAFNDEIKKQNKNIKWNLAYHAYSAVLTNADFWNDGSLAPNNLNADFVSPKNLEILTDYVKDTFGKDTRIILSEQGFSCSGGVGSPYNNGRQTGESVQAAAVAWLYYKAQFNDMIDAVIFTSGDHPGGVGYQFDFIGRQAENVYKYMDTPKYATYTKDCLKTIGKSSWKNAVKGFNAKTLKKMPTR